MTNSPSPAASDDARLAVTRRVGAATRELVGLLINTSAPTAELEVAADRVEELVATLRPFGVTSRYDGSEGLRIRRDRTPTDDRLFEYHPFAGLSNPNAPPLTLIETPDGPAALATYDHRHEGMPGKLHGGVLAAAFDLVLGACAARAVGRPAPTGRLTIRYRIPTPLHTELRYESRVERVDGRKIVTTATVSAGGEVTAEAEGLFIAARTEMLPAIGRADA